MKDSIKLLVGGKGEGKTKRLIDMANESVKTTDGHIVFIDDDRRHIFDLHYDIRFVDTIDFPLMNYRELIGFIFGILSQDADICEIYLDGINNLVKTLDFESLRRLLQKMDSIHKKFGVTFILSVNVPKDELPAELAELVI